MELSSLGKHMMATTNFPRVGVWLVTAWLGSSLLAAAAGAQEAAQGSSEAGQTKAVTCSACHGPDGNSLTPEWPTLAGQHPNYIVRQLKAFQVGDRTNVTMKPFDVAAYYAAQKAAPKGADPAAISLGQQIYRGGIPDRGVPACIACHGPAGDGNPLASYPRVAGQHAAYVASTLKAYAAGERRSDAELNQMMRNTAALLREDEIRAVASYVQGLGPNE
jgi:cytochrome c553